MAQFYDPIRDAWIDTDTGRELGQNETSLNVGATSTASISYQQFNEQHEAAGTDAKVNAYLADYVAKMRALGYEVEISGDTTADSLMYNLPPVYEVTVTKNGVSVGSVISEGQIQAWPNPADKASFDNQQVWGVAAAYAGVQSTYVPPTTVPTSQPTSAPGPASTVPVSTPQTSTVQGPPQQDGTTVVTGSPTGSGQTYTFEEWNWLYAQETGREGPAPEQVGITNRDAQMSRESWWSLVSSWFASGGQATGGGAGSSGDPTSGGAGGGGGQTPSTGSNPPIALLAIGALALVAVAKFAR